jgi:hypothetical protein
MKGGYYTVPSMPGWQRLTLSSCAAIVAYMLTYVGVDYAKLGHPYYFPFERSFRVGVFQGVPMGYVGLWLYALLAAAAVFGATFAVLSLRRAPAGERTLGLALAWTVTATMLAIGYYSWNNWP